MKRIKMALTAVAVVGVVGGTLAFKSAKLGNLICQSKSGTCTVTTKYIVDSSNPAQLFCNSAAAPTQCVTLTHVTQND